MFALEVMDLKVISTESILNPGIFRVLSGGLSFSVAAGPSGFSKIIPRVVYVRHHFQESSDLCDDAARRQRHSPSLAGFPHIPFPF